MDFLKTYAHQVVSYHPEKARDDLFNELYNELCEEFDDWQEEHPDGGEAAFLDAKKEHPMRFATRLAPEGSAYLIGPQFYYSFISALKVATFVTIGFHLFMGAITALGSGAYFGSITRSLMAVLGTLVWVYASILGVFILLEKSGEKATWLNNWTSSKLDPIDGHQPISKSEIFVDLGFCLLGLLWLMEIIPFPFIVGYDEKWISGWTFNLTDQFWAGIGILLVIEIAHCIYRLVKIFWSPKLRLLSIVSNMVWIGLFSYFANQALLVSPGELASEGMQDLQGLINKVIDGILYGVMIVLALDTMNHVWKLLKHK